MLVCFLLMKCSCFSFDDCAFLQAWDAGRSDEQSEEKKAATSLENCCSCVEQLGMQLYPNDAVFPEPHVCLRLELAAAGRWPEAGPASQDDSRVASAMLKVGEQRICSLSEIANPLKSKVAPAIVK